MTIVCPDCGFRAKLYVDEDYYYQCLYCKEPKLFGILVSKRQDRKRPIMLLEEK